VPADATALVVAAPSKPYSADEVAELSRYVKEGGKVFLELRPGVKTGLEKWLQDDFAVTPQDDLVLELNPSLTASFNPTMVAVMKYQFHAITQSFQNYRIPTVFVQTQSFKVADKKPEGIQIDSLAETDDKAEGRVIGGEDLNAALSRSFDEKKDVKGPLKLALAITATHKNPHGVANASGSAQPLDLKGRVVVFGTPYFASNSLSRQMSNIGNVDFALASLNWLAEEEALVSIPPKNQENRTVDLIGNAPRKVFLGAGVVPPLVLLIFGAVVWWRRR
jgi:hypothetical protein